VDDTVEVMIRIVGSVLTCGHSNAAATN